MRPFSTWLLVFTISSFLGLSPRGMSTETVASSELETKTPQAKAEAPILLFQGIRTTAYTHTESDHLIYGKKTAAGTELRYEPSYHSVAADWSRFPLGTKFRIRGYDRIFVVEDYGSALVGTNTLDLYFPDKERMNNWGVRYVDIEVLAFGSFHESRKIVAARAIYHHCRQMLAAMIYNHWSELYPLPDSPSEEQSE